MGNSNAIGAIFLFGSLICFIISLIMAIMYKMKKKTFEYDYLKIKWE